MMIGVEPAVTTWANWRFLFRPPHPCLKQPQTLLTHAQASREHVQTHYRKMVIIPMHGYRSVGCAQA